MLIDINKVSVGDRIRKDMGNLDELAEDIKKNGLINPPVVTPEYELIAGERRLQAMKNLGYEQVEVRVMSVEDAEHMLNLEINENENRKDFNKTERIEYARQLERIERAKAKERQVAGKKIDLTQNSSEGAGETDEIVAIDPRENFPQGRTRDLVAEKLGIGSGKQYEKEKYIADNADGEILKAWNEEKISTHKAYTRVKELEKQLKEQTEINESLSDELMDLRDKEPEVIEKEVIKEVKPRDYKELQFKAKDLDRAYEEIRKKDMQIASLKTKEKERIAKLEEYDANKKILNDLKDFMWTIDSFIRRTGGLIYLTDYYEELPNREKDYFEKSVKRIFDWSSQLNENLEKQLRKRR